jgi:hypothetical protein
MTSVNMFEVATRNAFRFQFKGMISVEDLWLLNARDLDSIYKTLNSQLKQAKEESLLQVKTQQDQELDTKIEIVKYIFQVKQEEENLRLQAKEIKEKKQKLMEILSKKQDASLENMSEEEIKKMLSELE